MTFNINVFRAHFRDSDIFYRIMQVPMVTESVSMLELIIKLAINVDFATAGDLRDGLPPLFEAAIERLEPHHLARLQKRIHAIEVVHSVPICKANIASLRIISRVLPPGDDQSLADFQANANASTTDDDSDAAAEGPRAAAQPKKRGRGKRRRGKGARNRNRARTIKQSKINKIEFMEHQKQPNHTQNHHLAMFFHHLVQLFIMR